MKPSRRGGATGPRTTQGKERSKRNAVKQNPLASGSSIDVEGEFPTLRWNTERPREALKAAGISSEQGVVDYIGPGLEATKSIYIRCGGQQSISLEVDGHKAQLQMLTLVFKLKGLL